MMSEGLRELKVEQAASNQQAIDADAAERKVIREEAVVAAEAAVTMHREMMATSDAANKQQAAAAAEKTEKKFLEVGDVLSAMATTTAERQAKDAEEAAEQKRKAAEDIASLRAAQITGATAQGEFAKMFATLLGQGAQPMIMQADVSEEVGVAGGGDVDADEEAVVAKTRAEFKEKKVAEKKAAREEEDAKELSPSSRRRWP